MQRLYYSISEVSELLNVPQPTLRYWEKEFEQLNPKRNAKGTRFYEKKDVDLIRKIIFLRDNDKLKVNGIKHRLNTNKGEVEIKQEIINRLKKLRGNLIGLRNQIK